uniref:Uncharacterized protein n=1 Tax=Arundo donax TaxID=35708 RepID=A0A0A8XNP9_ARUDO
MFSFPLVHLKGMCVLHYLDMDMTIVLENTNGLTDGHGYNSLTTGNFFGRIYFKC